MWKNTYKDYKPDAPVSKERVHPGKGIIGCEMQELNGWGTSYQKPTPRKKGILHRLLALIIKKET